MKKYQVILPLALGFVIAGCATPTSRKPTPREAFTAHWKETGNKVQVTQVLAVQDGMFRGNAIVDGRPVEEFYNPRTGEFSSDAPVNGYVAGVQENKQLYKDLMAELANEISQSIPGQSRIAILKFPASEGKQTKLSSNITTKLEMGLVNAGRDVVDREKIDQVLKEHRFQQSESALFDASTSARVGKFVGANTVITGEYHLLMPRKMTVTARVISVETAKVLSVKEKEVPLDGAGADNRDEIVDLNQ